MSNSPFIINQRVSNLQSSIAAISRGNGESLLSNPLVENLDFNSNNALNISTVSSSTISTDKMEIKSNNTSRILCEAGFDLKRESDIVGVKNLTAEKIQSSSLEEDASLEILSDVNMQEHELKLSGITGQSIELSSFFNTVSVSDNEGAGYQWGQRYTPLIPKYPESWGVTLRNINMNTKKDCYLALRMNPLSNLSDITFVRREMNTIDDPIEINDTDVARLNTKKFKAGSSALVQIQGRRLMYSTERKTRGRTQLVVKVWGTDADDEAIYNEISCCLVDEVDDTDTSYSVEIYSTVQFSSLGNGWMYDKGLF